MSDGYLDNVTPPPEKKNKGGISLDDLLDADPGDFWDSDERHNSSQPLFDRDDSGGFDDAIVIGDDD